MIDLVDATKNGKIFVVETAKPILCSYNLRFGEIVQIQRNLASRYHHEPFVVQLLERYFGPRIAE